MLGTSYTWPCHQPATLGTVGVSVILDPNSALLCLGICRSLNGTKCCRKWLSNCTSGPSPIFLRVFWSMAGLSRVPGLQVAHFAAW